MSELPLDASSVRRIAATHGIELDPESCERIAAQVGPALARLRELTAGLAADDDMLAFRRLLEQEAASG